MRTKINLKSGSILELDYAPYKSVMKLIRALSSCIQKQVKDFKIDSKFLNSNLEDFTKNSEILNKIFPILAEVVMCEELEPILFECGSNCLLNEERITPQLFESIELRQDLFLTFFNIAKYNLSVFFPKANTK